MNELRIFQLRQCLTFVREAQEALAQKDLQRAIRRHVLAVKELYFVRGWTCVDGSSRMNATAGLYRVLGNLADAIDRAARPSSEVPARELVEPIFEGLQVLQRNGVDVEDGLLLDRARNVAMNLAGNYEIRERCR